MTRSFKYAKLKKIDLARRSNSNIAKRLLFNDNKTCKGRRQNKTLEEYVLENNNTTAD